MASKQKLFLIIGNVNAVSYKNCFELFRTGKMWLGHSINSGDREFRVPEDYPLEAAGVRIDAKGYRYIRVKGVRWFTNMHYEGINRKLVLSRLYSPERYPKFDNAEAINVGKTCDIPIDYYGMMGVPITYIDKHDPQQFKIVGNEYSLGIRGGRCYLNGKRLYSRIFIRRVAPYTASRELRIEFPKVEESICCQRLNAHG